MKPPLPFELSDTLLSWAEQYREEYVNIPKKDRLKGAGEALEIAAQILENTSEELYDAFV